MNPGEMKEKNSRPQGVASRTSLNIVPREA